MSNESSCDLYLASASLRRRELLESMGLIVSVCPADIDETPLLDEAPEQYVQRLSLKKAQAARERCQTTKCQTINTKPFLGSDTIVACRGQLFGKPTDKVDAIRMWTAMSGAQHQVLTAVSVIDEHKQVTILSVNDVRFSQITDSAMQQYWQTGEPQDKAGAYAIQGFASAWVESIQGSFSGIMGLPLYETNQALKEFGLNWL